MSGKLINLYRAIFTAEKLIESPLVQDARVRSQREEQTFTNPGLVFRMSVRFSILVSLSFGWPQFRISFEPAFAARKMNVL